MQEKYSYYDLNVIKDLEESKDKKMFPVHVNTKESIKAIEKLGELYPDINYKRLWDKILLDFYLSLRQLEEILWP